MSKNEPQSYGSQSEWVTGHTGEKVNRSEGSAPPNSHEHDDQPGTVSPIQAAENVEPVGAATDEEHPAQDRYFKKRDYE